MRKIISQTEMNEYLGIFCIILLSAETRSSHIPLLKSTMDVPKTNVVSLTFCESAESKYSKETLEEVHTYAELKNDPRASLPESFTVCSTIMVAGCPSYGNFAFFNILDNNNDQFLVPVLSHGSIESKAVVYFSDEHVSPFLIGKVPPLFPNQWTKSCIAVNITSGLVHWVVEGTLLLDKEFEEVKKSKDHPKNLSRRLILGADSYAGSWTARAQKVTNLNIFSSPHLPSSRYTHFLCKILVPKTRVV